MKAKLLILLSAALLVALAVPSAEAACVAGDKKSVSVRAQFPQALVTAKPLAGPGDDDGIVGLWHTTFYLGNGPAIYDEGFELWHADGTELNVDNAVPPALGNVCVGAWKQMGKTIKLRHVTWNWNPDGTPAGTFLLVMSVTLEHGDKTFAGSYATDSYDLAGNVIPALHAEGIVRGQRITVE